MSAGLQGRRSLESLVFGLGHSCRGLLCPKMQIFHFNLSSASMGNNLMNFFLVAIIVGAASAPATGKQTILFVAFRINDLPHLASMDKKGLLAHWSKRIS